MVQGSPGRPSVRRSRGKGKVPGLSEVVPGQHVIGVYQAETVRLRVISQPGVGTVVVKLDLVTGVRLMERNFWLLDEEIAIERVE